MKPNRAVEFFSIAPEHTKPNGQYSLNIDRDDLPLGFIPVERSLISIPSLQVGGNHLHARREGFIAFGEGLVFFWRDEEGKVQSEPMVEDQLRLVVVNSLVPHAIKNYSNEQATLLEYAELSPENSYHELHQLVPEHNDTDS